MSSRRSFIGTVASGLATTIAAPNTVLGANDRVRLGIIGPGDRGTQLVREALSQPGVEFVAFSDIYSRRLEDAKKLVPNAATYYDYRRLLDDKSIDAVLIATPQHLHCEHFVAALDAGKHVYQEKTMAFTVEHAKRMRTAYHKAGKRIVQIGHQACSSGHVTDALFVRLPRETREDHRAAYAHVPEYPAWQAAVVATRLPGHDPGERLMERIPGRGAEA